ncbi:uncharacterized protein L969DRAFT_90420 [Mixia osmundae IAM 14324]|uniref:Mitochondrial inner membrane protease subunit n=1 Tax=Mixia osmundae (strain CBS 9802 / IAM 14324 / JCM 22182 / KY 12970) TaxID=764103 RepID=G7E2E6_MIXOS|nr:uncharacterized protein L969DRAFT_90420 [Mixia osmundae IAM 14324]KEI36877.1 hypothetical protein L969DRAFT_90420 [Mixia osmundae IAM 14324]GAA97006.1 hypothetical protein E5Q_03680 [Mixia osmundae IAM 14324]
MSLFARAASAFRLRGGAKTSAEQQERTALRRRVLRGLLWLPVAIFVEDNIGSVARITGRSMQPALNPDSSRLHEDVVLLDKCSVWWSAYQRGQVVVMRCPIPPYGTSVKRIIGLPGDLVKTRRPYPDRYVKVPEAHCWVEGDESFHSTDSNTFGPIPIKLIDARVAYILWPGSRWGTVIPSARPSRVIHAKRKPAWAEADERRSAFADV